MPHYQKVGLLSTANILTRLQYYFKYLEIKLFPGTIKLSRSLKQMKDFVTGYFYLCRSQFPWILTTRSIHLFLL